MSSKDLDCPRMLTKEEIQEVDWSDYTIDEIDLLIACGSITEQDMIDYFNNEWWRDTP